jgi:mannosyl-3-phosphoglycerate phosphatase
MTLLIFTDLDGSLLDHHGYSAAGARPALDRIKRLLIPLIFTTSKTRAEVEGLQGELGLECPFIVENGGGLFFPPAFADLPLPEADMCGRYRVLRFGVDYAMLRRFLEEHAKRFRIRGFGDMSTAEVAERTGLPQKQAAWAKKREFTEPFVCEGDLEGFREVAAGQGLALTRGGRFFHLMGARQDKGRAVRAAIRAWRSAGRPVMAIGVGDSENDGPLLANVEIPVQIPGPDGYFARLTVEPLVRARFPGSRGWGEAVSGLLDDWEKERGYFSRGKEHKEATHG